MRFPFPDIEPEAASSSRSGLPALKTTSKFPGGMLSVGPKNDGMVLLVEKMEQISKQKKEDRRKEKKDGRWN